MTQRISSIYIVVVMGVFFCVWGLYATLANAQPQQANVIVAPVTVQSFADEVEALGNVRANETIILTADTTAKLKEIHFRDGQTVEQGDLLVVLDKDQEEAMLKAARALYDERRVAYERAGQLQQTSAISVATLDERRAQLRQVEAEIEGIESRIERLVMRAPFSGVLGLREISVGALVQPGDRITTLDDLSVVKVDFDIPSVFLSSLETGLPIEGRVDAYPDRLFSGVVETINPQVDPVTRTVRVRARLPNDDMALRSGLLMTIKLSRRPREAMTIPEEALIKRGTDDFLFVVIDRGEGQKIAEQRQVRIGGRRVGIVEILDGINPDETIIIHGTDGLSDGAAVNVRAVKKDPDMTLDALLRQEAEQKSQ